MTNQEISDLAEQILHDYRTHRVPVPIDVLAHRMNLTTEAAALGDGVSGVLVVENNRGAIGYNSAHAPVRQRFTIAHEIAHYKLHINADRRSQLFIDRFVLFRRDDTAPSEDDRQQEVDANRLAAALLMPRDLLMEEIDKQELDLEDDEDILLLSKKFQVSAAAMANRLRTLYPF